MAENIVVNGVTYNGVDSMEMRNTDGQPVGFYPDAVRFNPQDLTDAQKAQARKNIGAISEADVPQKGIDYWTPADQESMVQDVIAALGTPVFGRVDAEKNIILSTSGVLADGTYKLWFEGKDGKLSEVCTYDHSNEPEVTHTNLFVPDTATLNTRMSGSSQTSKTENGYVMTAVIPIPTTAVDGSNDSGNFVAVPAAMWTKSANAFLYYGSENTLSGYIDAGTTKGTVVGNWVKIPLISQYGNSFNCSGITLSLYVKGSAITASDIQNIEIYFNEIPE